MSLQPKSYEEALARKQASDARRRAKPSKRMATRSPLKCRKPMSRGTKRLRAKPDPKMAAWSKAVLERDSGKCQWPGLDYAAVLSMPVGTIIRTQLVISPCVTGDTRIDPHHIAERSLRPDLKYVVSNGIALCRTHHEWLPLNRAIAVKIGLLSDATYEKAMKDK